MRGVAAYAKEIGYVFFGRAGQQKIALRTPSVIDDARDVVAPRRANAGGELDRDIGARDPAELSQEVRRRLLMRARQLANLTSQPNDRASVLGANMGAAAGVTRVFLKRQGGQDQRLTHRRGTLQLACEKAHGFRRFRARIPLIRGMRDSVAFARTRFPQSGEWPGSAINAKITRRRRGRAWREQ